MNAQEVLNRLSELEEYFFYKKNDPRELEQSKEELKQMHKNIKSLLNQWHNLTGCTIE